MATNIVDIDQVTPDIDPMEVGTINNPTNADFTHAYAGKEITIPAGESKQFPLTVCVHLAKHLAEKMIRSEFKKKIAGIKDPKTKEIESAKPIPDYKGKIWEKMKELVETESTFFTGEAAEGEISNKEKFIK